MSEPRNVFTTKTVAGALTTFASLLVLLLPTVESIAKRKADPARGQDIQDAVKIALVILTSIAGAGGTSMAIKGRYEATENVYTPPFMPGRNKEDVIAATTSALQEQSEHPYYSNTNGEGGD
jgi:hypothetical protein